MTIKIFLGNENGIVYDNYNSYLENMALNFVENVEDIINFDVEEVETIEEVKTNILKSATDFLEGDTDLYMCDECGQKIDSETADEDGVIWGDGSEVNFYNQNVYYDIINSNMSLIMKKIDFIANRSELIDDVTEMLMQFERDLNEYRTDLYMYYDETGRIYFDTFTNVGGNSWLDDDHVCIYSDTPHFNSFFEFYNDVSEIAEALEIDETELTKKVADFEELDKEDINDINCTNLFYYTTQYIKNNDDLFEKLKMHYDEYAVEEYRSEFAERAKIILAGVSAKDFIR